MSSDVAVFEKPSKFERFLRRMRWMFGTYMGSRHVATAETANGVLSFDSKDRTLGRQLCVYGHFEYDEMHGTVKNLKALNYLPEHDGGRVMDVGGYVGMISVGFLNAGLFDKALALEPNPNNFSLLQRNAEQNGLVDKIDARNVAVSDSRSTLQMELSEKNFGDHRIRSGEGQHNEADFFNEAGRDIIEIQALPLDELYAQEPEVFSDLRLVWMDIQGHEGKFFAGAKQFFSDHPKLPVVMEFWPYGLKRSGMSREQFCDTVKSMFNTVYVLDERQEKQSIDKIEAIFDQFDGPESGAHLLLIQE